MRADLKIGGQYEAGHALRNDCLELLQGARLQALEDNENCLLVLRSGTADVTGGRGGHKIGACTVIRVHVAIADYAAVSACENQN